MTTVDDYKKLVEKAAVYWGSEGNLAAAFLSKSGVNTTFMKTSQLFKMGPYKDDAKHLWIDTLVSKDDIPFTNINQLVAKGIIEFETDPSKQSKEENGLTLKIKTEALAAFVKDVEKQVSASCSSALDKRMPYESIKDLSDCSAAPGNKFGRALSQEIDQLRTLR